MPRGNKDNKKENLSDAPDTVRPLRPRGAAPRHGPRPAPRRSNKNNKTGGGRAGRPVPGGADQRAGATGRQGGAGLTRAGATNKQGSRGRDAATDQGHDEVKTGQRRVTWTSG